MDRYRVPSENIVYADTKGNIGWQVGGLTPIRDGWTGVLPVPGDEGRYEWNGFQKSGSLPFEFNPPRHYIATANHNILPPGYRIPLGFDTWALPWRIDRIREMLGAGRKFDIEDFERMQQDVTSLPARRFQEALRRWHPEPGSRAAEIVQELVGLECRSARRFTAGADLRSVDGAVGRRGRCRPMRPRLKNPSTRRSRRSSGDSARIAPIGNGASCIS